VPFVGVLLQQSFGKLNVVGEEHQQQLSISQTDLGDRLRVEFMMDNLRHLAHWLLTYGSAVEIESPDELKTIMAELVEELAVHYGGLASEKFTDVARH
jgi:predicted DNA-binding transcriptional regulator YafY